MFEYKGYLGTVEPDDGSFFGRVVGLRDVITFEGGTYAEVEQAFRDSIDDYLAYCAERGDPPDRTFSGKIPLRVPPALQRRAVARAQAEGLSLNQWVAKRIESAVLRDDLVWLARSGVGTSPDAPASREDSGRRVAKTAFSRGAWEREQFLPTNLT